MNDTSQSAMDDSSEHNETQDTTSGMAGEQMLLDYLLETGFAWDEAMKLLDMREYLYENAEMRQRIANDQRMHFARWLYEHGKLSENP